MPLHLLPPWPEFGVFLIAALAVGVSPGPGMFYAVARGISQGTRGAVVATLGLATGSLCNCLFAALGLSALLATSTLAYDIVRYAGAAYLLYLAIRMVCARSEGIEVTTLVETSDRETYLQAVVTNLVNPKSALFYLSFVPQFLDPQRGSVFLQFMVLGLIFNIAGNTVNVSVAMGFGTLSETLARRPGFWRMQRWVTASILGALALHLALAARR